jgi:hypothetical protein
MRLDAKILSYHITMHLRTKIIFPLLYQFSKSIVTKIKLQYHEEIAVIKVIIFSLPECLLIVYLLLR